MRRWCCAVMLGWSACSADPPEPPPIEIEVTVDDGDGAPVAGARISADDHPRGVSDRAGRAVLQLRGAPGQVVLLAIECPPGSAARPPAARRIPLRRLHPLGAGATALPRQQVAFGCLQSVRDHLLVVRTDRRAALPVRVTGRPPVSTDEAGVAQLVLRGAPGEEVEVIIDTSSLPQLRPANPSRRLRLPARSRFLIFDQRFDERQDPRPRRRHQRAASGPRRL